MLESLLPKRGRRREQLVYVLKETRGYWKLQEEALARTIWRLRFRRGYGAVVRQTADWMNVLNSFSHTVRGIVINTLKCWLKSPK